MQDTDTAVTVPRGWPPEAHVVSCSRFIAGAFLTVFVGLAVVTGLTLCEVRELRAQVTDLATMIGER